MAAMVAAVEERGYGATTVADLISLSGVSRSAFYRHFADREACFLATAESAIDATLGTVAGRYSVEGSWEERARDAMNTCFRLLSAQPAVSRLVMVESYAAGPAAVALIERAEESFEALGLEATAQLPGREGMPAEMVRALAGGMNEAIRSRLATGAEAELPDLGPKLLEAVLAHRTPPPQVGIAASRRRPGGRRAGGEAARADAEDPEERLLVAAGAAIAANGYAASSVEAIVARASVSLSALYKHFDGKMDLTAAALDRGQARMFAEAGPAFRRARGWPEAVRGAIGAIFGFLAADPDFARLGTVEVLSAGRWAWPRREQTIAKLERFLAAGFEHAPQTPPVAGELAVGSVMALVYREVREGRAEDLPALVPLATYIVLAPFLGAEAAGRVAADRQPAGAAR
jgi:AcrR family transcriptional regulator